MTPTFFPAQSDFRKWLKKNHKKETELLVGFYTVSSKKPSITWTASVDEALCFGWIDGVRKNIDEERYSIRFTPRKSGSIWSAINIKKVEALDKAGLMTTEGLKAFALRKDNKSKIYSHENETIQLNAAYIKEFKKNKLAWRFFIQQAPSYKKVIVHWIMTAKQEKTKLARLEKAIHESEKERRINDEYKIKKG